MSRVIASTLQDAVATRITKPGFLVELGFSEPLRLCSRADLSVLGSDWIGWDIDVRGLSFQGANAKSSVQIRIGNADLSIGALVLSEKVVGREVRVWKFYGDAPEEGDAVLVFFGVCTGAKLTSDFQVMLTAAPRASSVLRAPRCYVTRELGFTILPPKGASITFNGEIYRARSEE